MKARGRDEDREFLDSSSGSSSRGVVPSARGWASSNTSYPRALSVNRSRAHGGRKRERHRCSSFPRACAGAATFA